MIEPGARLGPYEIVSRLGAGGMGEVYRARDTRLDRSVALKVLPEAVARDEQARARFEREARAISALNHPNICTLFDVGNDSGVAYLVMELVDGQTLAQALMRGPLPLRDVLRYAIEIAAALDRAHRAGIVHRDLKPANVMITKSGVKLLDFGLARRDAAIAAVPHDATTMTGPLTAEGTIVGTLQYMSPEQLEGKNVDARSDLFAFGCLMFEMLTGRRAFDGESPVSVISAVMTSEPPPATTLAPVTPQRLERLVAKCLEKSAEDRWQNAGDLVTELTWIRDEREPAVAATAPRRRWVWPVAAALFAAIALIALIAGRPTRHPPAVVRAAVPLGDTTLVSSTLAPEIAVAPDGHAVVYVAYSQLRPSLWVRSLDEGEARPLANTEFADMPMWSPDGKEIAFITRGKLMRVPAQGGAVAEIAANMPSRGGVFGTWCSDDSIVLAMREHSTLSVVPARGGEPKPLPMPWIKPDQEPLLPQCASDADHILYTVTEGTTRHMHVFSRSKGDDHDLGSATCAWIAGDVLLALRNGTVTAQRLRRNTTPVGEPAVVATDVFNYAGTGMAAFTASADTLFYASSTTDAHATLFDRRGNVLATVGPPGITIGGPRFSHDGRYAVVAATDSQNGMRDLWLCDLARGTSIRLTATPADEMCPVFSPDDHSIAFSTTELHAENLAIVSTTGGEIRQLTAPERRPQFANDWARDGRIFYRVFDRKTHDDIYTVVPGGTPQVWKRTPFGEREARVSPDGKWVAYNSSEAGGAQIYIASIDNPADRVQIASNENTKAACWRGDGKELYFIDGLQNMYAVPITTSPRLDAGKPQLLFHDPSAFDWAGFDVTPDGQRFLVARVLSGPQTRPLNLVLNWQSLLPKR